jgi:4-amino-4-deoxy-L-arabinose transferase-like glycosyltransferase
MPYSHFSSEQITPLIISGILLVLSIPILKIQSKISLALLFLGSLGLGYFIANLDNYLILWDEQYHALVAKNLSQNFLKPTLYSNPILDYDYKNWTQNHIWLHKQPLFLWQMALSIKLFGTSEFAIRLPSILMHAIIPIFIYRIGKISINKETGFYGGLFFAVAYFPLELIAGRYSTDHNDIAFLFYVTASFWAWFEYTKTKNKYWLLIIGLFSGFAVLVKWLMGLLIYVLWSLNISVSNFGKRFQIKDYLPIMISSIISFIVFLPWQVYIHLKYPKEAGYEIQLNSKHFFEPIENHSESLWFYFTSGFKQIYGLGDLIPFIFLFAIIMFAINIKEKEHKFFVVSAITFVYLFYTMAQTKMVSFTIIVSPLIYLSLGFIIYKTILLLSNKIKSFLAQQTITLSVVFFIAFTALNLNKIQNYHTDWKPHDNHNRSGEQTEMDFISSLESQLDDENYVVFNSCITYGGNIPVMFYTDYIAYDFIPNQSQIESVRKKNKKIAVLNIGDIPKYIIKDKDIKLIEIENK